MDELQTLESELQQQLSDVQTAIRVLKKLTQESTTQTVPVHPDIIAPELVTTEKEKSHPVKGKGYYKYRFCANPNCGDKFTPSNSRQIFCQKSCNPNFYKKKLKINVTQTPFNMSHLPKKQLKYLKPIPVNLPI